MPSTVEASERFEVGASQAKCWEYFSDILNIGSCIPGCEQVTRLDGGYAEFKVKVKVGYLSKTFTMKAKFGQMEPQKHLSFEAEGPDAEISGNVEITSEKENGQATQIKYKIEIRAVSVIGKTAVAMLGKDIVKKQASEFATCVKTKLEEKRGASF